MPRYSVIVTRDATESVVIEVAARSEAEAEEKAREAAEYSNGWTVDDCNFHQPYTNGAELVDEIDFRTRADLMTRPAWRGMETDTAGNPCVWMNYYCDEEGREWEDPWSCQCEDDGFSPYESDWIGPSDAAEIALWESLPDAS